MVDEPFQVKAGEKIRFYVAHVGPNELSNFHVIGSIFDDVYIDGNPANHLQGMQTVQLPASGGAVVEFKLKEEGEYTVLTHQLKHAQKGATGKLSLILVKSQKRRYKRKLKQAISNMTKKSML